MGKIYQGNTGHGTITIHIWQVVSQAIAYNYIMIEKSNITAGAGVTYAEPTIALDTNYFNTINAIVKVAPIN